MGDWWDFAVPDGAEGNDKLGPVPDPKKPNKAVPVKAVYDQADYVGLCAQAGFKAETITAARVAWRETKGRPRRINPQPVDGGCKGPGSRNATGMFQIVPRCHPTFDASRGLTDPAYNASFAQGLQSRSGWGPWEAGTGQTPPAGLNSTAGPEAEWAGDINDLDNFAKSHYATAVKRGYLDGSLEVLPAGKAAPLPGMGAVDDAIDATEKAAEFLTSWSTWRRVLLISAGAGLVGVGLFVISTDLGDPVSKIVAAIPGGSALSKVSKR